MASSCTRNTPYQLLGASGATDPHELLAQFRADAHALTAVGLTTAEQVEPLAVRLTAVPSADEASCLPGANAPTGAGGSSDKVDPTYSHYAPPDHRMTLNYSAALDYSQTLPAEAAVRATYLHELGHSMGDESLMSRMQAHLEADVASPLSPDVRQAILEQASFDNLTPRQGDGERWQVTAREMKADVFELVALQYLEGPEYAKTVLESELIARYDGHWSDLTGAPALNRRVPEAAQFGGDQFLKGRGPESTMVDGHNTMHALHAFARMQESGEVQGYLNEGRANELVAKAVYEGFISEVVEKTTARLNIHHFNANGDLEVGLPPGVTPEQVTSAHFQGELPLMSTGMTVLVPQGTLEAMAQQGDTLEVGAVRYFPDLQGEGVKVERLEAVPGFEAFVSSSNELRVNHSDGRATDVYQVSSALENYLAPLGLESSLHKEINARPELAQEYYRQHVFEGADAAALPISAEDGSSPVTEGQGLSQDSLEGSASTAESSEPNGKPSTSSLELSDMLKASEEPQPEMEAPDF